MALTQERPHRAACDAPATTEALRFEAKHGRLDPDVVECVLVVSGQATKRRRPWPADLTQREVDVLRLVTKGLSNKAIARRLTISPRTVEHHV